VRARLPGRCSDTSCRSGCRTERRSVASKSGAPDIAHRQRACPRPRRVEPARRSGRVNTGRRRPRSRGPVRTFVWRPVEEDYPSVKSNVRPARFPEHALPRTVARSLGIDTVDLHPLPDPPAAVPGLPRVIYSRWRPNHRRPAPQSGGRFARPGPVNGALETRGGGGRRDRLEPGFPPRRLRRQGRYPGPGRGPGGTGRIEGTAPRAGAVRRPRTITQRPAKPAAGGRHVKLGLAPRVQPQIDTGCPACQNMAFGAGSAVVHGRGAVRGVAARRHPFETTWGPGTFRVGPDGSPGRRRQDHAPRSGPRRPVLSGVGVGAGPSIRGGPHRGTGRLRGPHFRDQNRQRRTRNSIGARGIDPA